MYGSQIVMDGNFQIIKNDVYLDGGSKSFEFNDGVIIWQDYRLGSKTRGAFFHGSPKNGNMILVFGDRRRLIDEEIFNNKK